MSGRALSRRDVLRGRMFRWLREEPAPRVHWHETPREAPFAPAWRRALVPVLRPPGAVAEPDFLAGCTRCGDCVAACPHGAVVLAPARLRQAAGTPMIDPAGAPCRSCPDAPCIAACGPGVLRPDAPRRMGTARLSPFDCLAGGASFCSVCVERCPVPGALAVGDDGRPVVDPSACTGCGVCQHVCPAPVPAISVLPALDRPGAHP